MSRADVIVTFIRRHYSETGKPPSVAVICENTKLTNREFYRSFVGIAEALKAAGVPVAEENIAATRKANEARRASDANIQRGVSRYRPTILEVKIKSPSGVQENQEAERLSPVMAELMKEDLLIRAIDNFNNKMESAERYIARLKSDVNRRIADGEHAGDYFLLQYHKMGFLGESLDEVFRNMLQMEREKIKALYMKILRFPDLQKRFEQFTV